MKTLILTVVLSDSKVKLTASNYMYRVEKKETKFPLSVDSRTSGDLDLFMEIIIAVTMLTSRKWIKRENVQQLL